MSNLTLIYAADKLGNFRNPDTDLPWRWPSYLAFMARTIGSCPIICDMEGFVRYAHSDNMIVILDDNKALRDRCALENTILHTSPISALSYLISNHDEMSQFFCIGDRKTIEAMAPFASRVLAFEAIADDELKPEPDSFPAWLPSQISVAREAWYENSKHIDATEKHWVYYDLRRRLPIKL